MNKLTFIASKAVAFGSFAIPTRIMTLFTFAFFKKFPSFAAFSAYLYFEISIFESEDVYRGLINRTHAIVTVE